VTLGLVVIPDVPTPVDAPDEAQAGVQHPLQDVTVVVPDAFCDDPGTYLLTVMRSRMNWRRRWLKLTKKDLAVFEVAIVGPAEVSDELVEHVNHNTDDIGDNEVAIGVNSTAIAALGAAHPVDLEDDVTGTLDEGHGAGGGLHKGRHPHRHRGRNACQARGRLQHPSAHRGRR